METTELSERIVKALQDKKARDITTIDVAHLTIVAEQFIIASGTSTQNVKSLAEAVDEALSKAGQPPRRTEGVKEGRWVAMDFGSVILHIFHPETREVYMLEKLWGDGTNIVSKG